MRLIPMGLVTVSSSFSKAAKACAALTGAMLVAGCASYGSFDENEPGLEQSIFGDLVDVVGVSPEDEPIDYAARAPLVAPPNAANLPAPQEGVVAANDPQWPQGSRERMAQVLASEDQTLVYTPGVDGVDIAATQALAARRGQPQPENNSGLSRPLTVQEMQRESEIQFARAEADAQREQAATVRGRRFLTDPPVDARRPSAEAPYGADVVEEEETNSWWPF